MLLLHFTDETEAEGLVAYQSLCFFLVSDPLKNCRQTAWLQNEELEKMPGNNFHQVMLEPGLKTVSKAACVTMARAG